MVAVDLGPVDSPRRLTWKGRIREEATINTIGLYYPFIHFKDDQWLKTSALYWDRMARIVPDSYREPGGGNVLPRDSDITRGLIDELDYVVNIRPGESTYALSAVFTDLLVHHAERLRSRYDVSQRDQWPIDQVTAGYAPLRDPHLAYVHGAKLDEHLVRRLEEEGLAMGHYDGRELWLGVHPRLAFVYMSALAEEAATVNGFSPTTDETLDHVAATGWSMHRLAATLLDDRSLLAETSDASGGAFDGEAEAVLAMMSISAVMPRDPAALTVQKIKEIRESAPLELGRLRSFLSTVVDGVPQLSESADPDAVAAHFAVAYEQEVRPQLAALEAEMRGRAIDTVEVAMGASIAMPPILAEVPMPSPLAVATAACFSLFRIVRAKRRDARATFAESPVAYLYRLEHGLEPRSLLGGMVERVRSFLTGV
jgi:Family of unknown function (DUF6236)